MMLELSEAQSQLLDDVLRQSQHTLLMEIARADDRAFREKLRQRHEELSVLRQRLVLPAAA